MERRTEEEVSMGIAEFLDTKRKLKVDVFITLLKIQVIMNVY